MNKQIEQLWVDATYQSWPKPNKFTAGEYDHHLMKFAKLIIDKCADAAVMARLADCPHPGDYVWEHLGFSMKEQYEKE
jgi:hypothetical protein